MASAAGVRAHAKTARNATTRVVLARVRQAGVAGTANVRVQTAFTASGAPIAALVLQARKTQQRLLVAIRKTDVALARRGGRALSVANGARREVGGRIAPSVARAKTEGIAIRPPDSVTVPRDGWAGVASMVR